MSKTNHDKNGQPLNRLYNQKHLNDRTIDELIGLAKGITADGRVNQREAEFLLGWLTKNKAYSSDRIINRLYSRILTMLEDDVLDLEEQQELFEALQSISGKQGPADQQDTTAATFPLNQPAPVVDFPGASFCLTGKFAYAKRTVCEQVIHERGGTTHKTVIQDTDYLVIGSLCSSEWIHTSYGRKIEKAMAFQENKPAKRRGKPSIIIIHEDHWAKFAFAE